MFSSFTRPIADSQALLMGPEVPKQPFPLGLAFLNLPAASSGPPSSDSRWCRSAQPPVPSQPNIFQPCARIRRQ